LETRSDLLLLFLLPLLLLLLLLLPLLVFFWDSLLFHVEVLTSSLSFFFLLQIPDATVFVKANQEAANQSVKIHELFAGKKGVCGACLTSVLKWTGSCNEPLLGHYWITIGSLLDPYWTTIETRLTLLE